MFHRKKDTFQWFQKFYISMSVLLINVFSVFIWMLSDQGSNIYRKPPIYKQYGTSPLVAQPVFLSVSELIVIFMVVMLRWVGSENAFVSQEKLCISHLTMSSPSSVSVWALFEVCLPSSSACPAACSPLCLSLLTLEKSRQNLPVQTMWLFPSCGSELFVNSLALLWPLIQDSAL